MSKMPFASALIVGMLFLLSALPVSAQTCSSDDDEDALLGCAFSAVEDCRTDNNCESDLSQAITVQDIVEAAADNCCDKSTKALKKCVNNFRRKMLRGLKKLPPVLRSIFRSAQTPVRNLKTNDCSTGTLGEL